MRLAAVIWVVISAPAITAAFVAFVWAIFEDTEALYVGLTLLTVPIVTGIFLFFIALSLTWVFSPVTD